MTASGDSMGIEVNWSASGGTVGSAGDFSSSTPGSFWVVARSVSQADKVDSANVLVVGPNNAITDVTITPKTLGTGVGRTRQFTALAQFQDGSQANVPIFWTASGGSIDQLGNYTPDTPGDHLVIAVVGAGLSDTAFVRVSERPFLSTFNLLPADDTVGQGAVRQYIVEATWSDGSTALPLLDFSTTGGIIDSTGVFVAAAPPGDYMVQARDRGGSTSSTGRVKIRPDDVVEVELWPASIQLTPGASKRFNAIGRTLSGKNVNLNSKVNWQAGGGTVTTKGMYVAGSTPGTYLVKATLSGTGLSDSSFVVIPGSTATLTQLILNPSSVTVGAGESTQFNVSGSWSDGSSATPSVNWSATGGTVTAQGNYTAGNTPGTYRVVAVHQGGVLSDTSVVTVTAPTLTSLSVSPTAASVVAGATQQFSVTALWTDGSGNLPPLTWSTTGGNISATGLLTAGQSPGTYLVIVRDQAATQADTAFVTVASPAPVLQGIVVNPQVATLPAGGTQQFYVQGIWTNGGTAIPNVNWTATGGSVNSTGQFQAGSTAGTYYVVARDLSGQFADSAAVTVQGAAPVLIDLVLTPTAAVLQPGATQQYSVRGVWTNGGSGTPPVTFSATGGTVNGSGQYAAGGTPGTYRVVVKQQGGSLADTVAVTIASAPPVLTGINVVPDSVVVATGGGQQYSVQGIWTNGGSGAPAVTWQATGGNINANGYFTAGTTTGTYSIVATQSGGSLVDTATVTVTSTGPQITDVTILPGDQSLQPGVTTEFWGRLTWSNGSQTYPSMDWVVTGGGTIYSSGHFQAGNIPGTWKVIGTVQGGTMADTVNVTITGAQVTQVTMTPATASLNAGAVQQFATTATWSDGVSRPVAVTYTATGGTIDATGRYTAGQASGIFRVVATCGCGLADTSTVAVTTGGGGTATLTSLQITPKTKTLAPGGTEQFSASAQWSDGSSTMPPITFTATGGSINGSGFYIAPSNNGNYKVIVRHTGGTLKDTASVSVQGGGGGGAPWFEENFSSYATTSDLLSYPSSKWSGANEDKGIGKIRLVSSGAPVGGKAMRYDFPDRTGSSQLCHDYTIGRNLKLPSAQTEIWVDMWVKFDSNFETLVPNGGCNGVSGNGYKFIFGRCHGGGCGRFEIKVGNGNNHHQTVWAPGLNPNPPSQVIPISTSTVPYSMVADGQWHRWRQHMRVGANGRYRVWHDNRLIYDSATDPNQPHPTHIAATDIYGIALGRNMNQGPVQTQSITWGRVQVWRTDPGW